MVDPRVVPGLVGRSGHRGLRGVLRHARSYLKAVDAESGEELYRFETPSGVIGNVMTCEHDGKQYVGILSGIGGWTGIGLAAGPTDLNAVLGAGGGYAALGGQLTVFGLPD